MDQTHVRRTGRHLTSCPDEAAQEGLRIDVLGPLRVTLDGREIRLTSRRQRALLVLFAVHAGTALPPDRLVEELWDGAPPPGALVTLRSYVSHLRKALGGRTDGSDGRSVIVTTDLGYRLDVDPEHIDVHCFRRSVAAGHRALRSQELGAAVSAFDCAVSLWRGAPLTELLDHTATTALVAELEDLHAGAVEGRLRALVESGRHVEAVAPLESLVTAQPLRESAHELLMLALYRSGRSADALAVHRRFRDVLQEQLGIDPGPRLDQLVTAVLNRDPRLDLVTDVPGRGPAVVPAVPAPVAAPGTAPADLLAGLVDTLRLLTVQVSALAEVMSTSPAPVAQDLSTGTSVSAIAS